MAEIALDGDWAGLASFESDESNRLLFLMGAMALFLLSIASSSSSSSSLLNVILYPPTSVARLTFL
jgi:hypothetical protein